MLNFHYKSSLKTKGILHLIIRIRKNPKLLEDIRYLGSLQHSVKFVPFKEWIEIDSLLETSPFFVLLIGIIEDTIPVNILDGFIRFEVMSDFWLESHCRYNQHLIFFKKSKIEIPYNVLEAFIIGIQLNKIPLSYLSFSFNQANLDSLDSMRVIGILICKLIQKILSPETFRAILENSNYLILKSLEDINFLMRIFELVNKYCNHDVLEDILINGLNNQAFFDHLYNIILVKYENFITILSLLNKIEYPYTLAIRLSHMIEYIISKANYNTSQYQIIINELSIAIRSNKLPIQLLRNIFKFSDESDSEILVYLDNPLFNWNLYLFDENNFKAAFDQGKFPQYLRYHNNLSSGLIITNTMLSDDYFLPTQIMLENNLQKNLQIELNDVETRNILKISELIANHPTLKSLKIKIFDCDLHCFLKSLYERDTITNVDLSIYNYERNSHPITIPSLFSFLTYKKFNKFTLNNYTNMKFSELYMVMRLCLPPLHYLSINHFGSMAFDTTASLPYLNNITYIKEFHFNYHIASTGFSFLVEFLQNANYLETLVIVPFFISNDNFKALSSAIIGSKSIKKLKFVSASNRDVPNLIYFNKLLKDHNRIISYSIQLDHVPEDYSLSCSLTDLLTYNKNIYSLSFSQIPLSYEIYSTFAKSSLIHLALTLNYSNLFIFIESFKDYLNLKELDLTLIDIDDIELVILIQMIDSSKIHKLQFLIRNVNLVAPIERLSYWILNKIAHSIRRGNLISFKLNHDYPLINYAIIHNERNNFITPLYVLYYCLAYKNNKLDSIQNNSWDIINLEINNDVQNQLNDIKTIIKKLPLEINYRIINFLPYMNAKRFDYYEKIVCKKLKI